MTESKRNKITGLFIPVFCLSLMIGVVAIQNVFGAVGIEDRYPENLVKAAQAFTSAPPTNRYSEAEALRKELPKCPLTSDRNIGSGNLRSYDFAHPSYILSGSDVVTLLGKPSLSETNAATGTIYSYLLTGTDRSQSWTLEIYFRTNRVVLSYLRGPLRKVF